MGILGGPRCGKGRRGEEDSGQAREIGLSKARVATFALLAEHRDDARNNAASPNAM
jgi:hypothetical protein